MEITSKPYLSLCSNRKKLGDYLRADGTMDWDKAKKDYRKFLQSVPIKNKILLEQSIDAVTFTERKLANGDYFVFCPTDAGSFEADTIYYDTSKEDFADTDFICGSNA